MQYYVGLDVSLKQTSICVVDQAGLVVREGVVDSDPETISVYVTSKAPNAVRIGLETGPDIHVAMDRAQATWPAARDARWWSLPRRRAVPLTMACL